MVLLYPSAVDSSVTKSPRISLDRKTRIYTVIGRKKESASCHSGFAELIAAAGCQGNQYGIEQAEHSAGQGERTGKELGSQQDCRRGGNSADGAADRAAGP